MSAEIELSLSELTALARLAARGAGYSWSEATEASFAVRTLHMYGFDGASALAGDLGSVRNGSPNSQNTIPSGIAVSDQVLDPATVDLAAFPVTALPLLAPFVMRLCSEAERAYRLSTPGQTFHISDKEITRTEDDLGPELRITPVELSSRDNSIEIKTRAYVPKLTYSKLDEWATYTYAPIEIDSDVLTAGPANA